MPLISVIVPVYKAEKHLERCVRSILAQSHKQLEVILVDDGSPDDSGALCDGFAKEDARVRVIHKENAGVSMARNDGIQAARGDFLAFVDADDWLEPQMYERLLEEQQRTGVKLVYCSFRRIYADHTEDETFPEARVYEAQQVRELAQGMFEGRIMGSPWRSLYGREAVADTCFPVDKSIAEDLLFNLEILKTAKAVAVIPDVLYLYDQTNEASALHRAKSDPELFYASVLQGKLALNEYWGFPIDHNAFFKEYVDATFLMLVRKLEEDPKNREVVKKRVTEGFFSGVCHYDKNIPLRRRIVCRLIRRGHYRMAVLVRKAQDGLMKLVGR